MCERRPNVAENLHRDEINPTHPTHPINPSSCCKFRPIHPIGCKQWGKEQGHLARLATNFEANFSQVPKTCQSISPVAA